MDRVFISPRCSLHFTSCLGTLPLSGYKYHHRPGKVTAHVKTTKELREGQKKGFFLSCKNAKPAGLSLVARNLFLLDGLTSHLSKRKKPHSPIHPLRNLFRGKLISWVRLTWVKGSRDLPRGSRKEGEEKLWNWKFDYIN